MRTPKFISPSSLSLFERDREEYYMKYMAHVRAPRIPQANYMAIGSAFDAYVKAALHSAIFGPKSNSEFELDNLLEEQVEIHNRDWARAHGRYVFDCYKISGAYDDLLTMLEESEYAPEFEFKIEGLVEGVPLLGKPDCRFVHANGTHVILDWKVNNYCSKHAGSPYKYYMMVRDGWEDAPSSRGCSKQHPKCEPEAVNGLEITSRGLEEASTDWATQLAIYSWLLGEPVNSKNLLIAIDQLVCKPQSGRNPLVRVAQHRARISADYQTSLVQRLKYAWKCISTGYLFDDLNREDNDRRCTELDQEAVALSGDGTDEGSWLSSVCRNTRFH